MALRSKDRTKPTHYPFLPFHLLRSAQLVSSVIVAGIMAYFLWQLDHENYSLPWTFILLLTVSVLTLASLTATIVLHIFHGLSPLLNLGLNSALFVLWAIGFALLSWWTSGVLSHVCNKKNWTNEMGIGVCRTYKALFSFSLVGCLSTLAALSLDIHIHRQSTRLGKYNSMAPSEGRSEKSRSVDAPQIPALPTLLEQDTEYNPNPSARKPQTRSGNADGYAIPEEQFRYTDEDGEADTRYRGRAA